MRVLLAALIFCLTACDTGRAIHVAPVPLPEGGSLFALTQVQVGEKHITLALSETGLHQHDNDTFQRVDSQLLPSFRIPAMDHIRDHQNTLTFQRKAFFTGFHQQLWFVDHESRIWMSTDGGHTFNFVEAPTRPELGTELSPATPLRLVTADHLYLLDARNIWQYHNASWLPVQLGSLPFDDIHNDLPAVIRNYLPATKDRPFDLLTVLSNQLLVYRHDLDDEAAWILTSTFPFTEQQLAGFDSRTQAVFINTQDTLYRSDDQGETWLPFTPPTQDPIEVALPFLQDDQQLILVGTTNGEIWRHDGLQWHQTHIPTEHQTITDLIQHNQEIWAATLGNGLLVSTDHGLSWTPKNKGLQALRIHDLLTTNQTMTLATTAGIFQKHAQQPWQQRHPAHTTALLDTPEHGLIAGTHDGRLLTMDDQTWLMEPARAPEVLPNTLRFATLTPASIVHLSHTHDRIMAWSHAQGAATTPRETLDWTPFPIPEALTNTLNNSTVTHILELQNNLVLTEQTNPNSPVQIWKSTDSGAFWAASHSFPNHAGPVHLSRLENTLYASYLDTIQYSTTDHPWATLHGPWHDTRIVGMHLTPDRAAILTEDHGRLELHLRNNIHADATKTLQITSPLNIVNIIDFQVTGNTVHILTPRALFTGQLPTPQSDFYLRYPTFIAIVGLFGAIGISFALLRRLG